MTANCNSIQSRAWGGAGGGNVVGWRPFTKSLIFHIRQDPVYVGELRHNDERFQGLHAPIIERETFERAQTLTWRRGKKQWRRDEHSLSDLRFGCFGRPMSVQRNARPGRLALLPGLLLQQRSWPLADRFQ